MRGSADGVEGEKSSGVCSGIYGGQAEFEKAALSEGEIAKKEDCMMGHWSRMQASRMERWADEEDEEVGATNGMKLKSVGQRWGKGCSGSV